MPTTHEPVTWPPPASPADHLVRQLFGLAAVRRELGKVASREIASHGFGALVAVRKRGSARVSDVACDLHIDLSVASRQVAALVEAGHLERQPDPSDGRAHVLQVTEPGREALGAAYHQMIDALEHTLADWDPAAVSALAEGLERLTESFQAAAAADAVTADPEVAA